MSKVNFFFSFSFSKLLNIAGLYLHFISQILPQSSFTKCYSNEIEQLSRTAKARQSISPIESAVSGRLENKEPLSKKGVFFEPYCRQQNTLQQNTHRFLKCSIMVLFKLDTAVTLKLYGNAVNLFDHI